MASLRRYQKLSPCQMNPMPANSKMDSPLVEAEPTSDIGSASVIMYLRRGQKLQLREMSEKM